MSSENKKDTFGYCPENNSMALFLDLDNFFMTGKKGTEISALIDSLKPWGNPVIRRAFSSRLSPKKYLYPQLLSHGFNVSEYDPQTGHKKNCTDIRLTVEVMETLHTRPGVKTYALATGDSDYLGLIARLRASNHFVIGLGSRKNTSPGLRKNCDFFLNYEEIGIHTRPAQRPAIAEFSSKIVVGNDSMKAILKKRNLYPPMPEDREKILKEAYAIAAFRSMKFSDFQNLLFERCNPFGFSKTLVRRIIHNLVCTNLIVEHEDSPLTARTTKKLPSVEKMEESIRILQLEALLSSPEVVADPLVISEVVWGSPRYVGEVENIISNMMENTV